MKTNSGLKKSKRGHLVGTPDCYGARFGKRKLQGRKERRKVDTQPHKLYTVVFCPDFEKRTFVGEVDYYRARSCARGEVEGR